MLHGGLGQRDRFLKALEAIDAASDLPGLQRAIDALRGPYGLSNAAFVAFGRPGTATPHDTVLLTYPPDWIEHYFRRRYHEIDPVIQVASRSLVPLDWDALDWSSPAVKRFHGEAEEAGVGPRGLALPSRGPSGAQAMLVVTSSLRERDWRAHSTDVLRDMGILANHVHARLLALRGAAAPGEGAARLSGRERETLQWAAVGKTIDQTAVILGLSSSAVRTYLDAARRKLNCLTKPQAVAVAMKLGLIEG